MSNKLYDLLKWTAIVVCPSVGAFYGSIAEVWGLPYAFEIPKTCAYVGVFLATILGISTYVYNKQFPAEVHDDEGQNADTLED